MMLEQNENSKYFILIFQILYNKNKGYNIAKVKLIIYIYYI